MVQMRACGRGEPTRRPELRTTPRSTQASSRQKCGHFRSATPIRAPTFGADATGTSMSTTSPAGFNAPPPHRTPDLDRCLPRHAASCAAGAAAPPPHARRDPAPPRARRGFSRLQIDESAHPQATLAPASCLQPAHLTSGASAPPDAGRARRPPLRRSTSSSGGPRPPRAQVNLQLGWSQTTPHASQPPNSVVPDHPTRESTSSSGGPRPPRAEVHLQIRWSPTTPRAGPPPRGSNRPDGRLGAVDHSGSAGHAEHGVPSASAQVGQQGVVEGRLLARADRNVGQEPSGNRARAVRPAACPMGSSEPRTSASLIHLR
jgi:hypothetical protein